MLIRFFILFLFTLIFAQVLKSQFSSDEQIREKFNYEIIQLEEFIDRFNFDNDTKLLKYLAVNFPEIEIERKGFLITLFDNFDINYKESLIKSFINVVCDSANPQYLNFYNNNWYAEVSCIIEFNQQIDTGKIILKNQFYSDSSSKWVISAIDSELLELPKSKDSSKIITPVSHGTDFIALNDVFKDGVNVQNYMEDDYPIDKLTYFLTLLYYHKIKLKQINKVRYHFLQIPEWAFTIDYYNRKELNSGWLISELNKMSYPEKEKYKEEILNINVNDQSKNDSQVDK